ncbi:Bacteriocin-protection, YdeI or OmpD-Associated [Agreia bicolorata]|uniref:Bacteriocin-protection, YdeI or OmpD-Associated n=1 Tax=Agreia bicolorata TaxID=110935 RepID=A0A1T4YBJ2_9MICO|nr:YdeI/OmpD-associated family protein [Agreia bicolorata]SKA99207.1 Bacteriocin-protection, YdeI or OmpD-Associated [Agreia bicolorata]
MRFTTTIVLDGNNTGIEVPAEIMSALGAEKRIPVVVTIGSHSYRSSVAPYKGRLMISLSAANRTAANVAGGDEVEVEIERDTGSRTVTVPAELARAFVDEPDAKARFEKLSYTNQNRIVLSIESAKTDVTRARRVDAALSELR